LASAALDQHVLVDEEVGGLGVAGLLLPEALVTGHVVLATHGEDLGLALAVADPDDELLVGAVGQARDVERRLLAALGDRAAEVPGLRRERGGADLGVELAHARLGRRRGAARRGGGRAARGGGVGRRGVTAPPEDDGGAENGGRHEGTGRTGAKHGFPPGESVSGRTSVEAEDTVTGGS
jgi:hypothetical protein